jgi:hypothetical protein
MDLRRIMRFSGGSGSGTPARPRRGSCRTRRGLGETHAWVWPNPPLGLAKSTLGLAVFVAVGPAVSDAVGHCLFDLRWMIWVDIYRTVLMMVIKCFGLIFLK